MNYSLVICRVIGCYYGDNRNPLPLLFLGPNQFANMGLERIKQNAIAALIAESHSSLIVPTMPIITGVKEQIIDMAMNNAGLRHTARVLKVGFNTVLRTLKNSNRGK